MPNTIEQAAKWFANRAVSTPMPGARAMFEIAANALREKAAQQWIPVTEGTPVDDAALHFQQFGEYPEYIVMIAGGLFATTLFFDGEGWFDEANEYYNVTHWMPLPQPPKGE